MVRPDALDVLLSTSVSDLSTQLATVVSSESTAKLPAIGTNAGNILLSKLSGRAGGGRTGGEEGFVLLLFPEIVLLKWWSFFAVLLSSIDG